MIRISSLVGALVFAVVLIPGGALPAGPAPGGGHPTPMVRSGSMGVPMGSGLCNLPDCRSGNFHAFGRLAGPLPGAHPPMMHSLAFARLSHPCVAPACKPGAGHPGLIAARRVPANGLAMDWRRHLCPTSMPDCHFHDHHHNHFHDFVFFDAGISSYDYYQPAPNCWYWSHRLQRWVWACGSYPSAY